MYKGRPPPRVALHRRVLTRYRLRDRTAFRRALFSTDKSLCFQRFTSYLESKAEVVFVISLVLDQISIPIKETSLNGALHLTSSVAMVKLPILAWLLTVAVS